MNDITEKYAELREELDNKDPLHRYVKLKEELDDKDPIKRYARIKEELDSIKEVNAQKFEENKKEREENTLEAMESLFYSLGGEESDVESKPEIVENAEERQEDVVEEPVGDVEEINLREEQPIDIEEREEELVSGLEPVIDAISKQESLKEKKEEVDPVSARIEKLEKWIQKIAVSGPGSGEVRILNMDDVDTTDLANNKILKYQSSSGKFIFTAGGGGGGDVDLSAVDQNIIPDGNGTRDLGGSSNKWKDLYLSGSTIVLGTTSLSIDESGEFQTQKTGDSSPSRVASFSKTNIPFTKADGTSSSIETKSAPATFSTFFDNMYVPFAKANGTDVTTLKLGS